MTRDTNHSSDHWDGSDRRFDSTSERLARLEVMFENMANEFKREREEAATERKEMLALMQTMRREMVHYKGVVGGIALVFSGIAVLLGLIKAWIVK